MAQWVESLLCRRENLTLHPLHLQKSQVQKCMSANSSMGRGERRGMDPGIYWLASLAKMACHFGSTRHCVKKKNGVSNKNNLYCSSDSTCTLTIEHI